MKDLGDILLAIETSDDQIAQSTAEAFGVPRVTVWPMSRVTDRDADILVQREQQQGDFPYLVRFTATPASGVDTLSEARFVSAVRALARSLNQDILTDTGVQYQDNFLLVTPRGDTIEVTVDDDGLAEDRIELTPDSKRRRRDLATVAAD